MTWSAVVDDTLAVLDAIGAERCHLIGWSGGGPHALACAARMPERVINVATIGSVAPYPAEGLDWLAGMGAENVVEFNAALTGPDELIAFMEQAAPVFRDMTPRTGWRMPSATSSTMWTAASLTGAFAEWMAQVMHEALRIGYWGWFDDDMAFIATVGLRTSTRSACPPSSGREAMTGWCRSPTGSGWPPTSPGRRPASSPSTVT